MTTEKQRNRTRSPTVDLLRASARGKLHQVIKAINEGAELAVNKNGHTSLHIASYKGFLDIVRILLSAGCELDIQDDNGDTALHRACSAGHDLIVRRLIDEGCSVDRQNQLGDTALHEAASRGFSRCVKALIGGKVNIGLRNKNLDTAIHLACANSHSGSLRLLLSSYPHSSPKNAQGDTPLHIAARFGHVTCARVLISSHCNVNLQNKMKNTALHISTIARHRKLIRVLLDSGASAKTILNGEGKSALDLSRENGDGETALMLLSGPRQHMERGRKTGRSTAHRRSHSEPRNPEPRMHENKNEVTSGPRSNQSRTKSATLPRKSYLQARAKWRRHERRKFEEPQESHNILEGHQRGLTVNPLVVPQLYSLYRDCRGDVRQKPVIDHLPNPTPEIVNSITEAVTNTKGELLQEIKKTNCLLEKKLEQIELSTACKVSKLDHITKERIHAERMRCLHRIDRRAMLEREVSTREKNEFDAYSTSSPGKTPEKNCQSGSEMNTHFNHIGSEFKAIHPRTEGFHETKISETSSSADFRGLQPYKTIKINSRVDIASPCNAMCTKSKDGRKFHGSLNFSDSAYGSLSPRPTGYMTYVNRSPDVNTYNTNPRYGMDLPSAPRHVNDSMHTLPIKKEKHKIVCLSEGHSETSDSITQRFFENITQSMEEWYERRLHDITERQQREMNLKVAELENKMELLKSSLKPENSLHGQIGEDLV